MLQSWALSADVRGLKNSEILSIIKAQISSWKKNGFSSIKSINKCKIEKVKKIIKTILDSFGYFDSEVEANIENERVAFDITLYQRYKLNKVSLIYMDDKDYNLNLTTKQIFNIININPNSYVDTKQINDFGTKISTYFENQGFAFVKVGRPELIIDKSNKNVEVIYKVTLNNKTIIDKTIINVSNKFLEPFIRNRILWKDGDVYDKKKIENTKSILMDSGIFSGIDITPKKNDQNVTTLMLEVSEALKRDIAIGGKYGTSEKLGGLLSWTHYNIDNKSSKLSTLCDISKKTRTARLKYDTHDLFYKRQTLASQVFHKVEDGLSYDVWKVGAESILWQDFENDIKIGVGCLYEKSKTKDKIEYSNCNPNKKIKFNAFGIPIGFNLDTTDSLLDPQKGLRCSNMLTPYFGNLRNITVFNSKTSLYIPISKSVLKKPLVIAAYTRIGSVFRNKKHIVPRDKLFFSGGANSIRGYDYQKIGKVNDDKKAFGGESVFEVGIEPRLRISEDLGLVTFFEGGNVSSSNVPHLFNRMLFSYGFGIRYYTLLGPIRIDLAFPTKRRMTTNGKRIDSSFNLYISIGQAF
ncbi:MAG: BamA/TamA family outer membrane protein [Holosporales bacterium]|jgi:translocation and assembly module TamA|nr:BamA/TamA family outer membrane protein [Holosporales bacterium]